MLRQPQLLPSCARQPQVCRWRSEPYRDRFNGTGLRPEPRSAHPLAGNVAPVPSESMLQCVRGMCTEIATAGLGYDVPGTRAWLYDLDAATIAGTSRQRDMIMPLCRAHADRIKVPVGWALDDQRAPAAEPVVARPEPSAVAAAGAEPLFRPRSRPEPAEMSQPEPEREPAAPSLLERAFRAAPSR